MKALAIDCAVSRIAIAAKNEDKEVKLLMDIGIRQSEKLLPAVDYVMKELSLSPSDLDYSAVTIGPGTFTGLRLGLSTLKALTLSHNVPVYGIPSLDAYAYPYRNSTEAVLSLIESKEEEYFCASYVRCEKLGNEKDLEIEEILKELDPQTDVLACGPGAKKFVQQVKEKTPLYALHCFDPENDCTESLFALAEKMIANKDSPLQDYDGPLYVRKSEAEIVLERKKTENK